METGGPGFPANHFDMAEGEHGMTLRDYFAAKAMQALLPKVDLDKHKLIADTAYDYADAMMKAREA